MRAGGHDPGRISKVPRRYFWGNPSERASGPNRRERPGDDMNITDKRPLGSWHGHGKALDGFRRLNEKSGTDGDF
jgi:hypothetical protein